jgi:GT2 family glycosyltransferase
VQTLEQAKAEREAHIADISSQLQEANSQLRTLEQANAEREVAQIACISSQLQEANSQLLTLEQKNAERGAKIANLSSQLQETNAHVSSREYEIGEMKRSIIWQITMRFHTNVIERALPCGTGRRRNYDMILKGCGIFMNEGCGAFLLKVNKCLYGQVPFLKQSYSAIAFDTNIQNDQGPRVPLPLDDDLLAEFAFSAKNLSEIKVLTATYLRRNSDIILKIASSINGAPIRACRVKGADILDNDYTSFKFKPIKDSTDEIFFVSLRSEGVPSAAVWYASEANCPNLQLYKSREKIGGCIGFQALANLKEGNPYNLWILKNEPDGSQMDDIRNVCSSLKYRPKISIITPVWNTPERWLRLAIESMMKQTYNNWEMCIVDGGSTKQHVNRVINEYAGKDSRIKVKFLNENKGIAGNSNEALSLATGEFVGFLDHDDELAPFALYEVTRLLNEHPELNFIYSDEDKIDISGKRMEPFFKPDWSPDMFLSYNYPIHITVIRKNLIEKVKGFGKDYDGAQDYDLFLKVLEICEDKNIAHIPKILYHWRKISTSAAMSLDSKPYADDAGKNALRDAMKRRDIKVDNILNAFMRGSYRIKYQIINNPKVTIIIPTKDNVDILRNCINSILTKTAYSNFKIILVDNQSSADETFKYYDELKCENNIKILKYDKIFNYASINNFAVSQTESEFILFLNNDIEVISGEWMTAMLEHAQKENVGAVGAKLLFSDNTIQHCGVILNEGDPFHAYYKHPDHPGYFGFVDIVRNCTAVTAACLLTRKSVFLEVGGFDENFAVAFNDVDYCLKLRQKGYLITYTPYARLYHHESQTRGCNDLKQARFWSERDRLRKKWGRMIEEDPYLNPNLTLKNNEILIN